MNYTKHQKQTGMLFGRKRSDVIKHPGSFSASAKKAGMSTSKFTSHVLANNSGASPLLKKRAVLARTFAKMRSNKK